MRSVGLPAIELALVTCGVVTGQKITGTVKNPFLPKTHSSIQQVEWAGVFPTHDFRCYNG